MHLVRIEDAAKFAGVSLSTIYRWIKAGHLPTVEVGGVALLEGKEFRRYLSERNQNESAAKAAKSDATR
jgi:excisionase family DNA binding protein